MDPWIHMSSVVAEHAAVSSDQALATNIGLDILKMGGNAADAAVATMVAVSLIQPNTCGIGGDCHCLFFKNDDRKVYAINGSGRSGENATLEKLVSAGVVESTQREFYNHGLWVSVPGAVAGMYTLIETFGSKKLTLGQILEPTIQLAERGVPVPHKTALLWDKYKNRIENCKHFGDLYKDGKAPSPGEKVYSQKLANTLKLIASEGVKGFYSGEISDNIVKEVQSAGGVLTLEDMQEHLAHEMTYKTEDALFVDFHGFRVWEMKPNTIGLVALVALNILHLYDLESLGHNSAEYIHIVSEAIKYAYLECWDYLCDPKCNSNFYPVLSEDVAKRSKQKIDSNKVCSSNLVIPGGNTSYVAAVDEEGNGCSLICSVSSDFGACLIPENCGFVLHDRLKCMSLNSNSPNVYGPKKLSLHTIIPSLVTDSKTGELLAVMGICGRWMQPQGRIQLLLNMIIFGMDPQIALNQPRFYVGNCRTLNHYNESLNMLTLEEEIPEYIATQMKEKGHEVYDFVKGFNRVLFGKGNIIAKPALWNRNASKFHTSWFAGADPRTDGSAMGF